MTEAKRMSAAWVTNRLNEVENGFSPRIAEQLRAHIAALEAGLEAARATALEEAALRVEGESVAVNRLPDTVVGANSLAAYLTDRDFKMAAAIRALKAATLRNCR